MKKTIITTISTIIALALTLGTFTSGQAKSNFSTDEQANAAATILYS